MSETKRVAFFCSGRGSNFDAILENRELLGLEITGLVCDQKSAPVIAKAQAVSIPVILTHQESEIISFLQESKTEWVILAGYMRILSSSVIEAMRSPKGHSRIINIHPSLLPSFPGLSGYRQAWEHGCKVTGVTIHFVEKELDQGPILAQESFSLMGLRDLNEVESRGLSIEHRLYSKTLAWALSENFMIEMMNGRQNVRPL